jgi:hypothetical protein
MRAQRCIQLPDIFIPYMTGGTIIVIRPLGDTLGPMQQPPARQDAADGDDDYEPVPE